MGLKSQQYFKTRCWTTI